jgi:AcrR family transcriptional regulator
MSSTQHDGREPAVDSAPAGPLYPRLPHGPHRLSRRHVVRHQRARIHGAMVEAVARNGYSTTSVKQVIELAGVSRRSFYELFANKEDCFLATFDLIADRGIGQLRRVCLAGEGCLERRLGDAFGELAGAAGKAPNAAALVTAAAQCAGGPGVKRLRRATATCEQLLASSFTGAPDAGPLPTPIVRAITGGLHRAIDAHLQAAPRPSADALAAELLRWTLLFRGAAAAPIAERMATSATRRLSESAEHSAGARRPRTPVTDQRTRLLHGALRLAVIDDYLKTTAPQIAEEADVPVESFFAMFTGSEDCYRAAQEMLAGELLAVAAGSALGGPDWPRAVRHVLAEMLGRLAANPLYAYTVGQGAFAAGPSAVGRNLELARGVARLLTANAPPAPEDPLLVEGIAGAIWHTIGCQVAGGRIQLLPALSDYLAYIVLAPYIGADAAGEIVAGVTRPRAVCD